PVEGEVLTPHSTEVLLYHPTMGDWRTHTGVDFSAEIGADVVASAEGTVLEVFTDAMSGVTIVIEHGNDVVTTYANLAPNPSVIEGEYVSSGQLIAVVGESALAEVNSPPHIHFEMKRDGVSVDPVAYLQVR
ncbi:MAG: M23 family metallopeptidase, partial [Eubacteriales bacterium]